MIKISHRALGGIIATLAIMAQLAIAAGNRTDAVRIDQERWKADVEARLVRVETKLDRLLNVNQAALDLAQKLPRRPSP